MNATATKSTFDPSRYYPIIVPMLMIVTFLALLGNLYLLVCIRWIRKQAMTANLRLSLSLAGADAWAAILLLNGWAVNNVIPHMFKIRFGEWIRCYYLILELLRLSGLITSAVHLLALALNHFFSIISPLKYQASVTPAVSYTSVCFLWLAPMLSMFTLGSAYEGDGFRTPMCGVLFYFNFSFRLIVFLQFAAPLLIMIFIYSYIVIRLWAARQRCALMQRPTARSSAERQSSTDSDQRKNRKKSAISLLRKLSTDSLIGQAYKNRCRDDYRFSFEYARARKQSTESRASGNFSFNRLSAVKHKLKAVTTTLLILGTFVVGWLPAVFMFLIVCSDCKVKLTQENAARVFIGNTMVNTLIVSKLLLNPFIYAYRLAEIRYAIWVMHATRLGRRPLDITRLPVKFRRMAPSVSANYRAPPEQQQRVHISPTPSGKLSKRIRRSATAEAAALQETANTNQTCQECSKQVAAINGCSAFPALNKTLNGNPPAVHHPEEKKTLSCLGYARLQAMAPSPESVRKRKVTGSTEVKVRPVKLEHLKQANDLLARAHFDVGVHILELYYTNSNARWYVSTDEQENVVALAFDHALPLNNIFFGFNAVVAEGYLNRGLLRRMGTACYSNAPFMGNATAASLIRFPQFEKTEIKLLECFGKPDFGDLESDFCESKRVLASVDGLISGPASQRAQESRVSILKEDRDMEQLLIYDRSILDLDRSQFMRAWCAQSESGQPYARTLLARRLSDGAIIGFGTLRLYSEFYAISPLYADDQIVAWRLLIDLLGMFNRERGGQQLDLLIDAKNHLMMALVHRLKLKVRLCMMRQYGNGAAVISERIAFQRVYAFQDYWPV